MRYRLVDPLVKKEEMKIFKEMKKLDPKEDKVKLKKLKDELNSKRKERKEKKLKENPNLGGKPKKITGRVKDVSRIS